MRNQDLAQLVRGKVAVVQPAWVLAVPAEVVTPDGLVCFLVLHQNEDF